MQAVWELYKIEPFSTNGDRISMFDKVCGTDYVRKEFSKRMKVEDIEGFWNSEVAYFKQLSKKYYIY